MRNFVAVHAGAGWHRTSDKPALLKLCKSACEMGLQTEGGGNSNDQLTGSSDICLAAIKSLEDSDLTNAGIGSNLTNDQRVECDAGLMIGSSLDFAGVGAVPKIRNPILLPYEMLRKRLKNSSAKTLVDPLILCGAGAYEFAIKCGIPTVTDDDALVTKRSLRTYEKCLNILEENGNNEKFVAEIFNKLDTVGCISVDADGQIASACSSGGILMKLPGRIGPAAVFGAGCWAEETKSRSVAVSVSGCGETLIKTRFAQSCAEIILEKFENEDNEPLLAPLLDSFFHEHYLKSKYLKNDPQERLIAGAIVAIVDKGSHSKNEKNSIEFAFVHNSASMCMAWMTSDNNIASSTYSTSKGAKVVVGGMFA